MGFYVAGRLHLREAFFIILPSIANFLVALNHFFFALFYVQSLFVLRFALRLRKLFVYEQYLLFLAVPKHFKSVLSSASPEIPFKELYTQNCKFTIKISYLSLRFYLYFNEN